MLDGLLDRIEVRHRSAEPAMVHVEHAAANRLVTDRILSLALGTDKKDVAPLARDLPHKLGSLFEMTQGLLEIHDVDSISLAEDVGLHLGVPAPRLVTEMDSRLEQFFHLNRRHNSLPYRLENWKRFRALG